VAAILAAKIERSVEFPPRGAAGLIWGIAFPGKRCIYAALHKAGSEMRAFRRAAEGNRADNPFPAPDGV